MYRCLMIIFLGLACYGGFSQDTLNYKIVDERTYSLYLTQDWEKLIEFGEVAVNSGFDYYYLHLRIGIAYNKTGKIYKSIKYFKKAVSKNSESEIANEYLFYAHNKLGNEFEWMETLKFLGDSLQQKDKLKKTK